MKTDLYIVCGILIGLLAAGIIWLIAASPRGEPVTLMPPSSVTVHVVGGVAAPGVYTLPHDSRVMDAIEAAGGFSENADRENLNLASFLRDGSKLIIPTLEVEAEAEPVNINTATVEELDTLPGIGMVIAKNIIDYREANGPFQSIEDIINVPGIGPATYERIRDLITVESE